MTGSWRDRFQTLWALGPVNLVRVGAYRLGIKFGLHPVLNLGQPGSVKGPYFAARQTDAPVGVIARNDWRKAGSGFGHVTVACPDGPPDWHRNILTGNRAVSHRPWHQLGAFDVDLGDIKGVWECSRFDWLLAISQRAALGDLHELRRLNLWLDDWSKQNPAYLGSNWMCGQEASIRVLHLAASALLLDQIEKPLPALVELIRIHLRRIAPTMSYAIGQDNNHGTSEAAALFVGGSWLERVGVREGARWAKIGRHRLAERAGRLIERDGSFSQYSLVYHRLMLDTYSFAETWRRKLGMDGFGAELSSRLAAATRWLHQMVDPATGDGPNLGANDGARIFVLEESDYRDFRPSLQWASALFLGRWAIPEMGIWDQRLRWFDITPPQLPLESPQSQMFDDGGYHVVRSKNAVAYLRFPRFRFRPSQADAMHLDLWVEGANLLRDGGTFSYASTQEDIDYFAGTTSHNSVMFDDRDQMPRLGRFLFGRWLKRANATLYEGDLDVVAAEAEYHDYQAAFHKRRIELRHNSMTVVDTLGGNASDAVLRWRLIPGEWALKGQTASCGGRSIRIRHSDAGQHANVSLRDGLESRYYAKKSTIPVIEVRVALPATLITEVEF